MLKFGILTIIINSVQVLFLVAYSKKYINSFREKNVPFIMYTYMNKILLHFQVLNGKQLLKN